MSGVRNGEFELKLELTPEVLQRVGGHPALSDLTVGQPVTRTLRSIYYDTPDHRLRAQGISFRLRSDGDSWLQTVKASTGVDNGISNPTEIETSVERPEPDLAAIDDRRVRKKIEKAVRKSVLEPVFETVVKRTTRRLQSGTGQLELALDEGVVRAGNAADQLYEAELELKSGNPECLLETAAKLFSTEPVRLAEATKAERGYNLVRGRSEGGVAPKHADLPVLRAGQTCGEAFALILQSATEQIIANRRAVLETDDPEGAHQLRVGLRRLRSAARAFRSLNDTAALNELHGHARALARTVGELRDVDVLIEHIYAPVAGVLNGDRGLPALREALLAHRARMRESVRAALCGPQWSALQLYLALWPRTISQSEAQSTPVDKFAPLAIKRQWKKVARSGRSLNELTTEQRHRMRKDLKALRYTVEFFSALYPEQETRRFLKRVKDLQETFGYLNDVDTAKQLAVICDNACEGKDAQRTAGFVLGWHNAEAVRRWDEVGKGWKRLKAVPQFWA